MSGLTGAPRDRGGLRELSTEQLRRMLRDLAQLDGEENEALVDLLLDELQARSDPGVVRAETDRAWRTFRQVYCDPEGDGQDLYPGRERPEAGRAPVRPAHTGRRPRLRRALLAAAVAAAVMAALTVPVFGGHSVLQVAARWTGEMFFFDRPGDMPTGQAGPVRPEFERLQAALEEEGITAPVCPSYIPEGFELVELDFDPADRLSGFSFNTYYERREDVFMFDVWQIYDNDSGPWFEKDDGPVETYRNAGVTHYIFTNLGQTVIAWAIGDLQCSVSGSLPREELRDVVDSIYQ